VDVAAGLLGEPPPREATLSGVRPAVHEDRIWATASLRRDILRHLAAIGLLPSDERPGAATGTKDAIRALHAHQRAEKARRERRALLPHRERLLAHLADGHEVDPARIEPELVPVRSDHETGELFRLATLLWSVPVSSGFGRRMRYLVRDRHNGKLIGVLALGDPVFNLRARDAWIGWTSEGRRRHLVHVMDAYVVGAIPPYSGLLCGKMIMALAGSAEVSESFTARYGHSPGIISKEQKGARLALVTVTSALGRSSLYNRLRLEVPNATTAGLSLVQLVRLGETRGFGHFQLGDDLFAQLRDLLALEEHPYASSHHFGQGPNWRFRVARVGLQRIGLNPDILRHGVAREVYALPLIGNLQDHLCGRAAAEPIPRPSVAEIGAAARARWIVPRSIRRPEFTRLRKDQFGDLGAFISNQGMLGQEVASASCGDRQSSPACSSEGGDPG